VHLDAPSLVVGQVQVQGVELQAGGAVDVAAHRRDIEEVTGDVEHDAAIREAGASSISIAGIRQPEASVVIACTSVCTP
jgi:hypothetical protein